jgi:predicted fused transcriptional regulator/phosphomethylpyrimidine kinase
MTPEEYKYYVLGNALEGLTLLEGVDSFASLIPEVRSNLVMCPQSHRDCRGLH